MLFILVESELLSERSDRAKWAWGASRTLALGPPRSLEKRLSAVPLAGQLSPPSRSGITLGCMASIDRNEVARVAALARIALTEAEIDQFASELAVISDAVAKVSEVASPDVPATSHPIPLANVWREDVVAPPSVDREEVLAMAPAAEDGKFKVPQILGEE